MDTRPLLLNVGKMENLETSSNIQIGRYPFSGIFVLFQTEHFVQLFLLQGVDRRRFNPKSVSILIVISAAFKIIFCTKNDSSLEISLNRINCLRGVTQRHNSQKLSKIKLLLSIRFLRYYITVGLVI